MSGPVKVQSGNGIIAEMAGFGILAAAGITVPTDGTRGYAPGCVFIDVNAAAGSTNYINAGSGTSCLFEKVATGPNFSGIASLPTIDALGDVSGSDTVNLTNISAKIEAVVTRCNSLTTALGNISS